MMTQRMVFAWALLAIPALAISPAQAQQQAPADGADPTHGFKLFVADGCSECHGTVGQGNVGYRLAPSPKPAAVIAAYIRNPAGEMPPYTSKVVSDADVRDIHAYLASVPMPPPLKDIPELN